MLCFYNGRLPPNSARVLGGNLWPTLPGVVAGGLQDDPLGLMPLLSLGKLCRNKHHGCVSPQLSEFSIEPTAWPSQGQA